ncbi:MAG: gliding motility-associated C-terminal domain-containing protein [Bacteroidota bacterium]
MRIVLLAFLASVLTSITLFSQAPANDECDGAIDLMSIPNCNTQVFTNFNATTSSTAAPSCFNGQTAQRDVWFSFEANVPNFSITILGSDRGNNGILENPQLALYRGDCNGLSLVECASSEDGSSSLRLDVADLTVNNTYFIRVNDFSATAAPNAGDFTICLEEEQTSVNMTPNSTARTTACSGTLFDSGGPNGDYGNSEQSFFVIAPEGLSGCIEIELISYEIEIFNEEQDFGDLLQFYAGTSADGRLLAAASGISDGSTFKIQHDGPITIEFSADDNIEFAGFELRWQCSSSSCTGSTPDNPTVVSSLPFNGDFSTCEGAATVGTTACITDDFLQGPDYIFAYDSPGGLCADINLTGAVSATGIVVLDGNPTDPNTNCVAQSTAGRIRSADFQAPGRYYIIVAAQNGCTDFNIDINESECAPSAALVDVLCNPLNGCENMDGTPSAFVFRDGFQDIEIRQGINNGCWLNRGIEPDFSWFTIQAQADGNFGFILESADTPSDLDFNVWGPFNPEEVCNNKQSIIDFIQNNQPIRSTWASGPEPTGMVDVNPLTGATVVDSLDCEDTPGAEGDDFVRTLQVIEGQVYVVLINDWGNEIEDGVINIDWSPSTPGVIAPIVPRLDETVDLALCEGETTVLDVGAGIDSIRWKGDIESLSCLDCPNPTASPSRTSNYQVVYTAQCYSDSLDIEVQLLKLNDIQDQTVCLGEEVGIVAGEDFGNEATYLWTAPTGITLSCLDCPNPTITAETAGTYEINVALDAPGCPQEDNFTLTVLPQQAPDYFVRDDAQICEGSTLNIGGAPVQGATYTWTLADGTVVSNEANPSVGPAASTEYFVEITSTTCPVPSLDSVFVEVIEFPIIEIRGDTTICQGDSLILGRVDIENDVSYQWLGAFATDESDPNTFITPFETTTFTLRAERGICSVSERVTIEVIPIEVDIPLGDTTFLCLGSDITISANAVPQGTDVFWTSDATPGDTIVLDQFTFAPTDSIKYFATVFNMGCVRTDSVLVVVDSLPFLDIEPADTMVCNTIPVILRTPAYEPSEYPDIQHMWFPSEGQETPDSLFNLVVVADTTREYFRVTTNNACIDTTRARIEVIIPPPLLIVPADTSVCLGESVDLQLVIDHPNPDSFDLEEIMWMPEDGSLSCTDCPNPTATPNGTTMYSVMAEIMGCPVSASGRIIVPNDPRFALTGRTTICPGDEVRLNDVEDPNVSYVWTSTDPNFGTVTEARPIVSPTETTTYFVEATRNGDLECGAVTAQITINVAIPDDPLLSTSRTEVCPNDLVTLAAEFESLPGDRFIWTSNPAGLNQPSTSTTAAPQVTTVYTFTLDRAGACPDFTGDIEVLVDPDLNLDDNIVLSASEEIICVGGATTLTATIDDFDSDSDNVEWFDTDGTSLGTGLSIEVRPTFTSQYRLQLTSNCAEGNQVIGIQVVEPPSTINQSFSICPEESVDLNPNAISGLTYTWTSNTDPTFGTVVEDNPTVFPTSTQTYQVDISNNFCPPVSGSEVTVFVASDNPTVNVGADRTVIRAGEDRRVNITASITPPPIPGDVISWTANGTDIGVSGTEFARTIDSTTTFTITYIPGGRCTNPIQASIRVIIINIVVPNAFTPNNDRNNDFFNFIDAGQSVARVLEFKVFNRWGQRVYNNQDPEMGWNGQLDNTGEPQPSDVYAYIIQVELEDGSVESFEGDVTLLR